MIGAIIGDIVGSRYEFSPIKTKSFELFGEGCRPTDDSMMTIAIAGALLEADGDWDRLDTLATDYMRDIGRRYIDAGYGGRFRHWLLGDDREPYGSYGNGGAMRVSAVAHVATSLDEAIYLADMVTKVTHNHIEGMKGAEAMAAAIYLAKAGKDRTFINRYIGDNFYNMHYTLDDIRDEYTFHVDSMHSVGESIKCFVESISFEDAVRTAVSMGGDSDTMADMAGAISEVYYGVPLDIALRAREYLDDYLLDIVDTFEQKYGNYIDKK